MITPHLGAECSLLFLGWPIKKKRRPFFFAGLDSLPSPHQNCLPHEEPKGTGALKIAIRWPSWPFERRIYFLFVCSFSSLISIREGQMPHMTRPSLSLFGRESSLGKKGKKGKRAIAESYTSENLTDYWAINTVLKQKAGHSPLALEGKQKREQKG
jgi:hypothetical protein